MPLLFFVLAVSCVTQDISGHGRVNFYGANNKNFTFVVDEDFINDHLDSPRNKEHPKLNEAESALLYSIMQKRNYCINNKGKILFKITSKQEKIYDMTFAHLIEQNYNARPVTPVTYFGECVDSINKSSKATHIRLGGASNTR